MKIIIVGSGGVGGYFGSLLAHGGQDVTFLARGSHLDAIRRHGMVVHSVHGDFAVSSAQATDDLSSVGPTDLVLICVKDYQLESVLPFLKALSREQTTFLPLLNGVRAAERLASEFGQERALGGLCAVVAFKEAPGVIRQESQFRSITFGEWDGRESKRIAAIHKIFLAAGIDSRPVPDVRKAMWTKFLFITAYSGVASAVRLPASGLRASPETVDLLRRAMEEIAAVGRAKGVALGEDAVDQAMRFMEGFPPGATASMQRDVEAGRMFELEAMTGSVVRYGVEVGLPTPVNSFLYAVLKPQKLHIAKEEAKRSLHRGTQVEEEGDGEI